MLEKARVAIVGAGFAGLILAISLARAGVDVTVFEEDALPGKPPHCTGIISGSTYAMIESLAGKLPENMVLDRFRKIEICGESSCTFLHVRSGLLRLNRPVLDLELSRIAERLGATIYLETKVTSVNPSGTLEYCKGRECRSTSYDIVVLAEGAKPRLRRTLKIGTDDVAYGVNYIVDSKYCDDAIGGVRVIFSKKSRPGYIWILDSKEDCIVGIASRRRQALLGILRELRGSIIRGYGGALNIGHDPPESIAKGRILLFGDSAGMNKPLTGGGLYPQSLATSLIHGMLHCIKPSCVYDAIQKSVLSVLKILRRSAPIAKLLLADPLMVSCLISSLKNREGLEVEYDDHSKTARELLPFIHYTKLVRCFGLRKSLKTIYSILINNITNPL